MALTAHFCYIERMDNWNEIRTAYHVALLGTVSAAARSLGVHRVTVIRHIDALESLLGEKLFQRHTQGYKVTEAGEDLMRVAKATDEQFSQLIGRVKGRATELSGDLVVTSLSVIAPRLVPVLQDFQMQHPHITVRLLTDDRLFKLEYGEAHIAVRTGPKPDQPDNVVQPFTTIKMGLYASALYASRYGVPTSSKHFGKHKFVGPDNPNSRAPFHVWMRDHIPDGNIVFRSSNQQAIQQAMLAGMGIGFYPANAAQRTQELIEVLAPQASWDVLFWLVTHVDLHRTAKVQSFLKTLKQAEQLISTR